MKIGVVHNSRYKRLVQGPPRAKRSASLSPRLNIRPIPILPSLSWFPCTWASTRPLEAEAKHLETPIRNPKVKPDVTPQKKISKLLGFFWGGYSQTYLPVLFLFQTNI